MSQQYTIYSNMFWDTGLLLSPAASTPSQYNVVVANYARKAMASSILTAIISNGMNIGLITGDMYANPPWTTDALNNITSVTEPVFTGYTLGGFVVLWGPVVDTIAYAGFNAVTSTCATAMSWTNGGAGPTTPITGCFVMDSGTSTILWLGVLHSAGAVTLQSGDTIQLQVTASCVYTF
jgi:hypothetical protein